MKSLKITFDSIVALRKFEGSLSFLGFDYKINDELMEIEIENQTVRENYKIEVWKGFVGVTFRKDEK